jgi:hypothetical protein
MPNGLWLSAPAPEIERTVAGAVHQLLREINRAA